MDTTPPPPVTDTQAYIQFNSDIKVSWTPVTDAHSGVAFYRVYRFTIPGTLGGKVSTDGAVTGGVFTDSASGLNPGITYYYTVRAVDNAGNEQTVGNIQVASKQIGSPVMAGLPDQTLNEDTSLSNAIDVWAYTSCDGMAVGSLTFAITGVTDANCGVSVQTNRYINIAPTADWYGAGTVPVAKFFKPQGKSVKVVIGGLEKNFTLDSKGKGTSGLSKFQMKGKMKKGVFKKTPAKFTLTVKGEPLLAALQEFGFENTTTGKAGEQVTISVIIMVDTMGYEADKTLLYKATEGKSGSAK